MYIVGASTLGRIVLDVVHDLGWAVDGFVDDTMADVSVGGVRVVGGLDWLCTRAATGGTAVEAFVAIGSNAPRLEVFRRLITAGVRLPNLIHPRAYIARTATMGRANLIAPFAYVGSGVVLGDANLLLVGSNVHHDNVVGDGNFLAPNVTIAGRTRIGHRCKFGSNSAVGPDLSLSDGFVCEAASAVDTSR
ncbi:MAG: hypothetical protein AB7L71_01085 [Vicinamibacterales bacterium]